MSGRKVSAAQQVIEAIAANEDPFALGMTDAQVASALDDCQAAGWITEDDAITPAGREAARR